MLFYFMTCCFIQIGLAIQLSGLHYSIWCISSRLPDHINCVVM